MQEWLQLHPSYHCSCRRKNESELSTAMHAKMFYQTHFPDNDAVTQVIIAFFPVICDNVKPSFDDHDMIAQAIALHTQQESPGPWAQEKFQLFCSLDQDLYVSVEATSTAY